MRREGGRKYLDNGTSVFCTITRTCASTGTGRCGCHIFHTPVLLIFLWHFICTGKRHILVEGLDKTRLYSGDFYPV